MYMKRCNVLVLSLMVVLFAAACGGGVEPNSDLEDSVALSAAADESEAFAAEVGEDEAAADTVAEEAAPEPVAPATQTSRKPASSGYGGAKETIYVSTYGANGKVWGYVTMNGNTGRGTIHDDNENTLSIRVTRHGGELFGIDQNGREYVFRM